MLSGTTAPITHLDKVIVLFAKMIWSDDDGKWLVTTLVYHLADLFTTGLLAAVVFEGFDIPLFVSDADQNASKISSI